MGKKLPEFTIIRDTREKPGEGWTWDFQEKKPGRPQILGTVSRGMPAGDYSVLGIEDKIIIERKAGWSELMGNYSKAEHRKRFEREMEKMRNVHHKYILVESVMMKDVMSLGIPQHRSGPPIKRLWNWLAGLSLEYGVHTIPVGDFGKQVSQYYMELAVRKYL